MRVIWLCPDCRQPIHLRWRTHADTLSITIHLKQHQ